MKQPIIITLLLYTHLSITKKKVLLKFCWCLVYRLIIFSNLFKAPFNPCIKVLSLVFTTLVKRSFFVEKS